MATITAVELGADTCAFARTSVRRGEVRLSAAEILDPSAFPGAEAFTLAVRQTRRTLRLPRRCRAVVWGLPEGANRKDAAVTPLLEPLTAAGFRVERVVSPCNALAALARLKTSRGQGSTCWLAINRGGVAIVVVRPGKQLYAHSFAWDSNVGASGSQARLLQRYSLVSFLSPEVKRAMAEARKYGTPVDAIVTCGNLPDLRSLTMPLIEELDVEVETLDSLEGLVVKPAIVEKLADAAPAIRLACAGAIARGSRPWDESKRRSRGGGTGGYIRAAAVAAAAVGIVYLWYARTRLAPRPAGPAPQSQQARTQTPGPPMSAPAPARVPPTAQPPAVTVPGVEGRYPMAGQPPTDPRASILAPRTSAPTPAVTLPKPAAPLPTPAVMLPKPAVTLPKPAAPLPKPAAPLPKLAVTLPKPAVTLPKPAVTLPRPAAALPKPDARDPRVDGRGPTAGKLPTDPRPAIPAAPRTAEPAGKPPAGPRASPLAPRTPAPAIPSAATPVWTAKRPPVEASKSPAVAVPTVPRNRLEPLVTVPRPNVSAPSAPTAAAPSARPNMETRPPASATPPAVSAPPPVARASSTGLNTPAVPADKPGTEVAARAPSPGATGAGRGPMPALLKDAVPRVTAILVSRDRRFATVEGGQIIGVGDLIGRRTVVGMDERSVVFQEPSGVQIRIGLGGRLMGVGRAAR